MKVSLSFRRSNGIGCASALSITALVIGCASTPEGSKVGASDVNGGGVGGGALFANGGAQVGSGGRSGASGGKGSGAGGGGPGGGATGASGGSPTLQPDAAVSSCGQSIVGLKNCGTQTVSAQIRHPNMLIVLDKSGSTVDQPAGFNVSIWEGMKLALATSLEAAKARVSFGLELFPTSSVPGQTIPEKCGDNCCDMPTTADIAVPIEDGVTGVPKILAVLNATVPSGGTPTAVALKHALEYFTVGAGASLQGEKFVMLATDGGPNCNAGLTCPATSCTLNLEKQCMSANCCASLGQACVDDQATIAQIQALRDAGINTFVVGIPGSEAYSSYLDQFAKTGNQVNPNAPPSPFYYRVDASAGVAGLTAVFSAITTQLVTSCEIAIDTPVIVPDKMNVAINCEAVPQLGTSGTGTDGWVLDAVSTPAKITLQGSLCRWVQQQGVDRIDIVFGCPTIR
jgi:hypothetical protein